MKLQPIGMTACLLAVCGLFVGMAGQAQRAQVSEAQDKKAGEAYKGAKVVKSDAEWKKILTPEQYYILRQQGTERAFSGKYWHNADKGVYICAGCGLELFASSTKFDSGTGWPSFYAPAVKGNVTLRTDPDGDRTEVSCSRCGGHLGHVFTDGPLPTGLRYCMDSDALNFRKQATAPQSKPKPVTGAH